MSVSHSLLTVVLTSNSTKPPSPSSNFKRTGISAFGDQVFIEITSDAEKSIGTSKDISAPPQNSAPAVLVLLTTVLLVLIPDGSGFASTAGSTPPKPTTL